MTAIVRIFCHESLITAPSSSAGGRFASDSVGLLKQPYIGSEKITVGSGSPLTTAALTAPNKTGIAFVQVQAGKTVHYQVTPGNMETPVDATDASPVMSGDTVLNFGPQWRISFLECTDS
jgi:hypothetical protein